MFLSREMLFSVALQQDPALIEYVARVCRKRTRDSRYSDDADRATSGWLQEAREECAGSRGAWQAAISTRGAAR
jgi:hypothetical protein